MAVYLETPRERALNRWEYAVVDAEDCRRISTEEAAAVLNHVWQLYGMPNKPPVPRVIGPDQDDYIPGCAASVSPTSFKIYGPINTVTVLHEAAHLMTEDPLDRMERRRLAEREIHGDLWLSLYVELLDRLMGPKFNRLRLMATLQGLPCKPAWSARTWAGPVPPR